MARLHREEVGSPSMEVFKNCRDVALRHLAGGHGEVGLGDLKVFSNLRGSIL